MAKPTTAYLAKAGDYSAASDARQSDRQLLSLVVERGMDGTGGRCVMEFGGAGFTPVEAGAPVSITLDAGQGMLGVFTGTAYATETTAVSQVVRASDSLAKLARIQVEGAYADVSADFVVKDLLSQAGADAGTVARGPQLPAYVVHRNQRALRHLETLAALCGADLFTDGDGKVNLAEPKTGGSDHSFKFGETVLALELCRAPPGFDGVEVWGEGAASSKGSDKAHWLSTDLSGVSGKASVDTRGAASSAAGTRPLRVTDGAIRSGGVAQDTATAWARKLAARWLEGSIEVFGAPEVQPGDLIEITGLPADHGAAELLEGHTLRVRSVRHTLDRDRGLRTRLEF
jgi:hypothetical protein